MASMADPESLNQQTVPAAAYWVDPWPSFREIAQKSLNDDHTARLAWRVRRSRQVVQCDEQVRNGWRMEQQNRSSRIKTQEN
jgi:hypothetical protein